MQRKVVMGIGLLLCFLGLCACGNEQPVTDADTSGGQMTEASAEQEPVTVSDISLSKVQAVLGEEPVSHLDVPYPWLFLGIPVPSYEEAAAEGEVKAVASTLPGAASGTWYTVTCQGVEYHYGCYDHAPERYELFSYALVDEEPVLTNGLHVGMTEQEIIDNYPAFAKLSFGESNYYAFSGNGFPDGFAEEFDCYYAARVICECVGTEEHVPVTILLMIKDGKIKAITTDGPTAG